MHASPLKRGKKGLVNIFKARITPLIGHMGFFLLEDIEGKSD